MRRRSLTVSARSLCSLLLGAGLLAACTDPAPPPPGPMPAASALASISPAASASASASASAPGAASAAPLANKPVVIGEQQTFRSNVLGEDRTILVHTPASYAGGKAAYPVLYLLDGEDHFHHTTGITTFLAGNQRAPEMIVVGVANTQRTRDLTPTPLSNQAGSGGSARFLSFLRDELRPRIEAAYRTVPYRILVGHSLGGLFTVHTLLNAPEAYQAYIAISPSLWWDDQLERRGAEAAFAGHPGLQAFLYFTVGHEPGKMAESNNAFAALLKTKAPPGLRWEQRTMERESHNSIPHRSTYDGLEALFSGWEPPESIDTVKALVAHQEALAKRFPFAGKLPEATVNMFGYRRLDKHPEEALAAFELNVKLYPDSPNVYDSLGEAQEKLGKRDLARQSYETAVRKATETSDPLLPEFKKNLERLRGPASK